MSKIKVKKTWEAKNFKFFRSSHTLKYLKLEQPLKLSFALAASFLLAFVVSGLSNPASNSSAISPDEVSGSDTAPVSVSVSNSPLAYYISVSSSHGSTGTPVSFSYSQDGSSGSSLGNVVSSSDLVSIETNSPMSHQLLLSTTSPSSTTKSNNLTGTNTKESGGLPVANTYIAPVSGTTTSSLSTATALTGNTWGFAMSNTTPGIVANNFDADYSTTTNASKFATVPTSGNEVLLTEDTTGTSNTTIYYGVLADRDIPAGSYSNTILYTALAEQPSEIRVSPSTIDLSNPNQLVTIYTSINTTSTEIAQATATVSFYRTATIDGVSTKVEEGICTNPTINLDGDNFLYVTCTSPNLGEGSYTAELTLTHFGRVLTQNNAITYTGNPLIEDITTMQQMTQTICNNLPYGTTDGHNIYTLKDSRDNKSYKIAHLKDGNCWMVQNLALDGGRTLTPADSNVTQNRVLPANITIGTDNTILQAQIVAYNPTQLDSNGYPRGNLYNWIAATATTGSFSNVGVTTYESSCAKGWRLPNYGTSDNTKTYQNLLKAYNLPLIRDYTDATTLGKLKSSPLYFTTLGLYEAANVMYIGAGEYLTRDVGDIDDQRIYTLNFATIDLHIWSTDWHQWGGIGDSVRCVFGS